MFFTDYNYTNKKCSQIHSWYLYEQYKSLEKNQLDAAKKLKERCGQERLLHQELSEIRTKRYLYDQHEPMRVRQQTQQECNDSCTSPFSTNADDLYDDLRGIYVEDAVCVSDLDTVKAEEISLPSESSSEEMKEREKSGESNSVGSAVGDREVSLVAHDLAKRLEYVKKDIEENEGLQIEKITNTDRSRNVTKCCSAEKLPATESEGLADDTDKNRFFFSFENSESILKMWSRLVCFAYQVVQFNRGNCYSDSTSQLLLAILACDVVKKGFYEMCTYMRALARGLRSDGGPKMPSWLLTITSLMSKGPKLCISKVQSSVAKWPRLPALEHTDFSRGPRRAPTLYVQGCSLYVPKDPCTA
ncbi:hypothetical protein EVAR_82489_1 [Eumeta japonica]|uniref:Uncharacterized protein n=1 Tax=Eumeta variegata TaxID=151549 RepID=A0A4C1UXL6_EUMVA|nr:hypothetical protein EVAR_82489_1 [Eumeta japonica]